MRKINSEIWSDKIVVKLVKFKRIFYTYSH